MVRRQKDKESSPAKMAQTFFVLDADTQEPLCFSTASSARIVTQATRELLSLAAAILKVNGDSPLGSRTTNITGESFFTGSLPRLPL